MSSDDDEVVVYNNTNLDCWEELWRLGPFGAQKEFDFRKLGFQEKQNPSLDCHDMSDVKFLKWIYSNKVGRSFNGQYSSLFVASILGSYRIFKFNPYFKYRNELLYLFLVECQPFLNESEVNGMKVFEISRLLWYVCILIYFFIMLSYCAMIVLVAIPKYKLHFQFDQLVYSWWLCIVQWSLILFLIVVKCISFFPKKPICRNLIWEGMIMVLLFLPLSWTLAFSLQSNVACLTLSAVTICLSSFLGLYRVFINIFSLPVATNRFSWQHIESNLASNSLFCLLFSTSISNLLYVVAVGWPSLIGKEEIIVVWIVLLLIEILFAQIPSGIWFVCWSVQVVLNSNTNINIALVIISGLILGITVIRNFIPDVLCKIKRFR